MDCTEQQRYTHRSEIGVVHEQCEGRSLYICESLGSFHRIIDEDCKPARLRENIFGARTSSLRRSAVAVAEEPIYKRVDANDELDESPEDDD